MSATSKVDESARRRKWAPKQRSGCQTCKERHVKCDETKPQCVRCFKGNFFCKGFSPKPKDNGTKSDLTENAVATVENGRLTRYKIITSSPYRTRKEQQALDFYLHGTAKMMNRSRIAPLMWRVVIPQVAFSNTCVRNALLSTAEYSRILYHDHKVTEKDEEQSLMWANKSIVSLINEDTPAEAVLLSALLLGCLDLFTGRWKTAYMHLQHALNMIQDKPLDQARTKFIKDYSRMFLNSLSDLSEHDQDVDTRRRIHTGVEELQVAIWEFRDMKDVLKHRDVAEKERILRVIGYSELEAETLIHRWNGKLKTEYGQDVPPQTRKHLKERTTSPWASTINSLRDFVYKGQPFNLNRFEICMERTLPFYGLIKAGGNPTASEDVVEIMAESPDLRKKAGIPSVTQEAAMLSENSLEQKQPRQQAEGPVEPLPN